MSEPIFAISTMARWRDNPMAFAKECIDGFEPDDWQVDFFRALVDPKKKRIALKAAKGPGKTAVLAVAIWWFLATQGGLGSHPKGYGISITKDNLLGNLWPELQKWRSRSRLLTEMFEWSQTKIVCKEHPATWFFSARSWSKDSDAEQQANALAGLHEEYTLIVADESAGIPNSVMSAAEGSLSTGTWNKIIQAGNPTHNEGPLYRAATSEANLWHLITVTGDPDDPKRSKRIKIDWCREQIAKYGRDNPWVRVNVFNEFPQTSINALFGPEQVDEMMKRVIPIDDYRHAQKRIGVDCARFGDDKTVLFPRQGLVAFAPRIMRNARSDEIASAVAAAKMKFGSESEFIDDTGGFGSGVIDCLIRAGQNPIPVQFAGKPDDPRYLNKRAEMWFRMKDWGERGGALPSNLDLKQQLTTVTYTFSNGKFQIEPKDKIKERLGHSPDEADALACTFAVEEMPANDPLIMLMEMSGGPRTVLNHYDVLRDDYSKGGALADHEYRVI